MFGAIIGDIIGSRFEFHNIKTKEFELFSNTCCFTDDTILTCAVADALLHKLSPDKALLKWGRAYLNRTYENGSVAPFGKGFTNWLQTQECYQSPTNGCIMRVSPIGLKINDLSEAIKTALRFTCITHNHPESICATQAYIETMFLAKNQVPISLIKQEISGKYGYDLSQSIDEIRPNYNRFYCSCKKSVPQAIICALDAVSFEDAVRNAVSLGGDSDTLACMAGGIAEARFGVPENLKNKAWPYLDESMQKILREFYADKNYIQHFQLKNQMRNDNQHI